MASKQKYKSTADVLKTILADSASEDDDSTTCRCAKVAPAGHALRKHWARLAKAICFYARSAKSFDFLT